MHNLFYNNLCLFLFVEGRFGDVERAAVITPKPAKCMPTLKEIELKNSNDSTYFYYPSCTRIERCGGCCSHSLLSCQPTETETVTFQVNKRDITSTYQKGILMCFFFKFR